MENQDQSLSQLFESTMAAIAQVVDHQEATFSPQEVGVVKSVGNGIARVEGLPNVKADELLLLPNNILAMAFNLDPQQVGIILLGDSEQVQAGDVVKRTGRVLDVAVGDNLIGRVISPTGEALDQKGHIATSSRLPIEREAKAIMDRAPVTVPLQTGIKVVDALIPIGRGQRELILGDRQTGKTAIALDTIINQKGKNVLCIYCAIGQRNSSVAKVIADLKAHGCLEYSIVVVASGDQEPGLQYIAPYAATTIGEYFMEKGQDVLLVYDDLTAHARAYREVSLLLRRPPGREAFPGDIFYIHSRLLERSTHLREELGGGSLTALPIVETEAQNLSAYIPTNLISITDGQIYLSPELYQKGILPAVEVGRSVSRVGGKTQLPAYRAVAGDLRLSYSQFQELEVFARFGTRLDDATRQTLERGKRVREIFKQSQYQPLDVATQIGVLLAVIEGCFDDLPLEQVAIAEETLKRKLPLALPQICGAINQGEKLTPGDRQTFMAFAQDVVQGMGAPGR